MTTRTRHDSKLSWILSGALLLVLAVVGFLSGTLLNRTAVGNPQVGERPKVIVRDSVVLTPGTLEVLNHSRDSVAHRGRTAQLAVVLARKAILMGDEDLGRQLRELIRAMPDSFAAVVLAEVNDSAVVAQFLRTERLAIPMIAVDLRTVLASGAPNLGMPSLLVISKGSPSALMLWPQGSGSGVRLQSYANALGFPSGT